MMTSLPDVPTIVAATPRHLKPLSPMCATVVSDAELFPSVPLSVRV